VALRCFSEILASSSSQLPPLAAARAAAMSESVTPANADTTTTGAWVAIRSRTCCAITSTRSGPVTEVPANLSTRNGRAVRVSRDPAAEGRVVVRGVRLRRHLGPAVLRGHDRPDEDPHPHGDRSGAAGRADRSNLADHDPVHRDVQLLTERTAELDRNTEDQL